MIKIIAKQVVKKGKEAEFESLAKKLVEGSLAEEGNISYSLNISRSNPQVYAIIECWKDQAAIDFHNATPHFTEIVPKLGEFCEGEMSVELFDEV